MFKLRKSYMIIAMLFVCQYSFAQKKKADTNQHVRTTYENGVETTVIRVSGEDAKRYKHLIKKDTTKKDKTPEVAKKERVLPVCECVNVSVEANDSIKQQQYITYSFVFKNNCKNPVWIYTKNFGYKIFTTDGKKVKVLRRLTFVERYNYPPFVMIFPNKEFEITFADDPFYEYDIRQGHFYQFRFGHYNTKYANLKDKSIPTYICEKVVEKMVLVK